MSLAIEACGLVKRFGAVRALAGVDLAVPAGEVLGLLGPNGSGKTTAVRILTTLLSPDGGRVRVLGHDVVRQPARVRRVIGLSGQYAAVDGFLTGRENLRLVGRLCGLRRAALRRRVGELLELFDLTGVADRAARTYSGGMRRRLDVAAGLVGRPAVLFLDEPTTGLDPRGRIALWRLLTEVVAQGATLLLTTQYLEEVDRLADRIVVLDQGRVVAAGSPAEVKGRAGGDRLELVAAPGVDPGSLAAAVAGLGAAAPSVDRDIGRVVLPVDTGPAVLPEVSARLSAGGLRVSELALRRPTLDEAFLALTGGRPGGQAGPAGTGTVSGAGS